MGMVGIKASRMRLDCQDRSGEVRENLLKYVERGEFIDRSGI